ncbi:MAG TPA: transglycosylase SLT domain-containing protein, partial [Myxococcota bacterium]|nr:transglycosylase SLT domain-containing protein [Myxococcota bacterium]
MITRAALPFALAFTVFASAGSAQAETSVAMLTRPGAAEAADEGPSLSALRAAIASEARHLGVSVRDSITHAVARAAREQGLPAFLLVALIAQESGFDPQAENAGALGLMQVRPFVARDYARRRGLAWKGEASLRDPAHNVQLASGYLGEL